MESTGDSCTVKSVLYDVEHCSKSISKKSNDMYLFQREPVHSTSLLYHSINKYPTLRNSDEKNHENHFQELKQYRTRRSKKSHTYTSNGSQEKSTRHDRSGSWQGAMSRSTASGSQVLSSPEYPSEHEDQEPFHPDFYHDSSDLYPFTRSFGRHIEDFDQDELEEGDVEEKEQKENEEDIKNYETKKMDRSPSTRLRTTRTGAPQLSCHNWYGLTEPEEEEKEDEDEVEEEEEEHHHHGQSVSLDEVDEESFDEDSGRNEECSSRIGSEQEETEVIEEDGYPRDEALHESVYGYYAGNPLASSEYPDFPDYSRYETAKSQDFKKKNRKKLHEEPYEIYDRDVQSNCDISQYQLHPYYHQRPSISNDQEIIESHPDYAKNNQESAESQLSDGGGDDDSESYAVHDTSFEPFTLSEIDAVINIVYDPQKGRCVVARKVFQPGEIIFIEVPTLVAIPSIAPDLWEKLQQLNEEKAFELPPIWHLASLYALTRLSAKKQNIILDKWVPDPNKPPGYDVKRVLNSFRLSVDPYRYERFLQAWRYNSFGHHTQNDGLVLYNRISMISHNCSATATWHYGENDAFILRARQFIPKGSEITISYIGDDDLYKATHTRQEKLAGWLFTCQCVRCMDPCDSTRGFRCPCCGAGTTFFRTEKNVDDPSSEGLTTATACTLCQRIPSAKTIKKYLLFENAYIARLDDTDKSDLPDAELVYSEAQRVFTQHWVLYALDSLLFSAYRDLSLWDEARVHQQNRIQYITQVVPKASYTLAWLYEELGDIFANGISENFHSEPTPITGFQRNFLARMYETAMNMLFVLCGSQHSYTLTAHKKLSQVFGLSFEEAS